jgi:hypothetical protein
MNKGEEAVNTAEPGELTLACFATNTALNGLSNAI